MAGPSSDAAGQGASPAPQRVIVVVGPTGVGKSASALALADMLGGHVEQISCDSVQLYEGLDIGSNKPTASEQERCRIHLVDWLHPTDPCSAAVWAGKAIELIADLHDRGVSPIVVGGSCMYADWLLHSERGAHIPNCRDLELRAQVEAELQPFQQSSDWHGGCALLQEVSPERAARLTVNDWRRLARHLEAARAGEKAAAAAPAVPSSRPALDFRAFFLSPADRPKLYHTIDARCVAMLRAGLLQEVAELFVRGDLQLDTPAADAIGYRQVLEYLLRPEPRDGDVPCFQAFLRKFGTVSRNYARKQAEWFLKDQSVMWIPADPANPDAVAKQMLHLATAGREDFDAALCSDASVRAAQVAQGLRMSSFQSKINSLLDATELQQLLAIADACTRRLPDAARREARPAVTAVSLGREGDHTHHFARVYWLGRSRTWGWGNPLGKLHKAGMQLVEGLGWQRIEEDNENFVPIFCWPVRGAGDFPASGEMPLPLIRPFPQSFSDLLDNKGSLARLLAAGGHSAIHPETWSADEFVEAMPPEGDAAALWFLKHNMGVKGNAVHPYIGAGELLKRLESMPRRTREHFIVQRGVAPPALRKGRKWVLRAHVLLHAAADGLEERWAAYCHRDVIRLEHGLEYKDGSSTKAAHVSNAGSAKHWPKPEMLEAAADAELLEQVYAVSAAALAAVWHERPRAPFTPRGAQLCQVFGLDIAADAHGKAWLLEVNSYPAISGGTMEHVDVGVYTALVRDVLNLVVLPCVDEDSGLDPRPGGFVRLDVEGAVVSGASRARVQEG